MIKPGRERLPAGALLLAGGRGTRMGGNKLFLSVEDVPLLERLLERMAPIFNEVVLCVGWDEEPATRTLFGGLLERYAVTVASDRVCGRGPIEGLRQGLAAMACEWGFLLGCDMPFLQEAVVRMLWKHTPAAAQVSAFRLDGYLMPLHAFYRRDCVSAIDGAIARAERRRSPLRGDLKLKAFYSDVTVHEVPEQTLAILPGYRKSFSGVNTPEELQGVSDEVC